MIIDTHLHLVNRARLDYPWLGDAPALNRDWTLADYSRVARRIGITGTLHMEVDVASAQIEAETAMVADLMAEPGSLILGAISSARPEDQGFAAWLERQDHRVLRGIRRVLHVVPDDVSQLPLFRQNVARLGEAGLGQAGLPFDICMLQRQLPLAAALADACPDTIFVLDHCGVPDMAGDFGAWADAITDLARRPNLNAKISGLVAYGGPDWSVASLRPWVEHVITAFGWDRVVWGSDSPVCTLEANLEQWLAASQALVAGCSADERAALFHRNATRIWHL